MYRSQLSLRKNEQKQTQDVQRTTTPNISETKTISKFCGTNEYWKAITISNSCFMVLCNTPPKSRLTDDITETLSNPTMENFRGTCNNWTSMAIDYGDVIMSVIASQNHQPRHCLLNHKFRCRSKKTSKLRVTGLCAGNSPGTGEFPAQMASNVENVSIWWRQHAILHSNLLHGTVHHPTTFPTDLHNP